jgi:hypothetical protein
MIKSLGSNCIQEDQPNLRFDRFCSVARYSARRAHCGALESTWKDRRQPQRGSPYESTTWLGRHPGPAAGPIKAGCYAVGLAFPPGSSRKARWALPTPR